jgi:hypothetical protein
VRSEVPELLISAAELERLRRIEEAAKKLLVQMEGRKSPSERLAALAELRAALQQEPS